MNACRGRADLDNLNDLREDCRMDIAQVGPLRVMRIIARMNVGGPAVQVAGLMRGLNPNDFNHRLYTGFCAADESDYLETVATDLNAIRIVGLGRRVSVGVDIKAFVRLIHEIRNFKPQIIHTHTAKAGFLGRIASVISGQPSIRVHTFHGHLLNGYFGSFKLKLNGVSKYFAVNVGGQDKFKVNEQGVVVLHPFTVPPTPVTGSIYYGIDNAFYFGL